MPYRMRSILLNDVFKLFQPGACRLSIGLVLLRVHSQSLFNNLSVGGSRMRNGAQSQG
jgi:hypothetical protein